MIIKEVCLENFGIYGDTQKFDLTPAPKDGFNRPIVLFKGKNGAGKTTLSEAIRLCLHGSLALGSRIGRAEYEKHLADRLHRPSNTEQRESSAKILLTVDYIDAGRRRIYQIERSWLEDQGKIIETIEILEDGNPLAEINTDQQKETFLREMVSPRVAHIFFFDGENLEALADDESAASLLKDTVETLFGLNLVGQLQRDLDVYLTRQEIEEDARQLQYQLKTFNQKQEDLQQELANLEAKRDTNEAEIKRLTELMNNQKQKIASEGGWFAEQLDETEITRQRLLVEIDMLRKQAQELANGLLPFAIAPQMNRLVAQRLQLEQDYEQAVSTQQVLTQKFEQISAELAQPDYWAELDLALDAEAQDRLLAKLEKTIKQTAQPPDVDPGEIMFRVSDQDRQSLLAWIDRAADEVPRDFCGTIHRLNALERELERVNHEMELVPSDETLQPLVETLHQYSLEVGVLEKLDTDLGEQIESLKYQMTQVGYQLDRVRQQLDDQQRQA